MIHDCLCFHMEDERVREAMVTLDPIAMDVCHRFIPWTEFVDVDFLVSTFNFSLYKRNRRFYQGELLP